MSTPKVISEKDQSAIVDMVEKFLPDDDRKLEAGEIIKHLGDTLSEDAGENPIIEHLSKNAEKSFSKDEMKVISGRLGVEAYKENYEASIKEPETEPKKESSEVNEVDSASKNEPTEKHPENNQGDKSVKQRINELSDENKVIFKNLKEQWMKSNRKKKPFSDMSNEELNLTANEIILDALEQSLLNNKGVSGGAKPIDPNQNAMRQEVYNPIKGSASGNALAGTIKQAFKLAYNATSAIMHGTHGAAKGVSDGISRIIEERKAYNSPKSADVKASQEDNILTSENESLDNTYEDRIVKDSRENLSEALLDIEEKSKEITRLKKEGNFGTANTMLETNQKLRDLSKSVDNVNDMKNILSADLKRKGVSKEERMEGIKAMNETKKSLKGVQDSLGNSENEKEVKQRLERVIKAIDRMLKAIKNMFTKERTNEAKNDNPSEVENKAPTVEKEDTISTPSL
tara:strand:+ start:9 stop:1382 length:1374 start_codon:yes stop_codon:yes gene_type:complete